MRRSPDSRILWERSPRFSANLRSALESLESHCLVLGTGCFDLLHEGHMVFLRAARAAGDKLVIGVNSDASVKQLKGPARPVVPEVVRSRQLLDVSLVDLVVVVEGRDATQLMQVLRPHVFATAASSALDYPEEIAMARRLGTRIELVEREGNMSTTRLLEMGRGEHGGANQ